RFNNLIPEVVEELKKNNIEINTWTVNKEEDIKDLINKGIDILIGNYPDLVKKIINENK
ncbi:MAG: glycerophosphodiester phosphodiesterase, partial [Fusobacterium periodonticum]|nr:glycerophosphodiester phosphodiesterase [Fusobacterium periodonticum]